MPNRRPQLEIVAPSASPEEAAAVVAALERFMRDTTPPPAPVAPRANPWQRTALLEGVAREAPGLTAWGDGMPWGG
jgi:cell division protein FtsN